MDHEELIVSLRAAIQRMERDLDRRIVLVEENAQTSWRTRDVLERLIDDVADEDVKRMMRRELGDLDEALDWLHNFSTTISTRDVFDPIRILIRDIEFDELAREGRSADMPTCPTQRLRDQARQRVGVVLGRWSARLLDSAT